MMQVRDWLAGVAAAALLGAAPASAQAPRSLFDALPAGTIAPETNAAERPVAKRQAILRTAVPLPPVRPDLDDAAQPAATAAATGAAAPAILPPPRPAAFAALRPSQRVEPEPAAAAPEAAPAAGLPSPTPSSPAEAQTAPPVKPMTRAEKRRAEREARAQAAAEAAAPAPAATPTFASNPFTALFAGLPAAGGAEAAPVTGREQIDALVRHHARLNNVPEALVHRVIVRESRYNPRAVGRGGAMGLMQIKTATARGVGYPGGPAGLLDAETNLTYGIKYLAGAWRVAGGSHDRAVSHYARGYYYAARGQGRAGRRGRAEPETTATAAPQAPSLFSLFAQREAAAR